MEIMAKWFTVVKYYLVNPFTEGKCLDDQRVCGLCVNAASAVQM